MVQTPDGLVPLEDLTNNAAETVNNATEALNAAPSVAAEVPAVGAVVEEGPISRERATEIALELVSGTVIEVDRDIERGRLVWYVAIREGGTVHEIYVDRSTGEIVRREAY